MSGVLESLQNPLERLQVLPTSVSLRLNPLDNSPVWDVSIQYFRNDVVISGVNGGAYVFTGGLFDAGPPVVDPLWTLRGGVDPALDTNGYWQKLTQTGQESAFIASPAPTFTITAGPPQTIAVSGSGSLLDVASKSNWEAILHYTVTYAAPIVASDLLKFTVAGNGTNGESKEVDVVPLVGATVQSGSAVWRVYAGETPVVPAPVNLALSASCSAGTAAIASITGTLTWIRID